jgi:serine protease SohB
MVYHFPMNDFVSQYALFVAETATLVLAIITVAAGLVALSRRKYKHAGQIRVTDVNHQIEEAADRIQAVQLPRKAYKLLQKKRKLERKAHQKGTQAEPCNYLLEFKGDIRASAFVALREEITAILQVARAGDAVFLRLESGGGVVNRYGLAAAQLLRPCSAKTPKQAVPSCARNWRKSMHSSASSCRAGARSSTWKKSPLAKPGSAAKPWSLA